MPNDAFDMLCINTDSMMRPGTMKAQYSTPSMDYIRVPIAVPNTTKYKTVEITGDMMLCTNVRKVRAISKK